MSKEIVYAPVKSTVRWIAESNEVHNYTNSSSAPTHPKHERHCHPQDRGSIFH